MLEIYNDATLIDLYNRKNNEIIRKRIETELKNRGRVIVKTSLRYVLKIKSDKRSVMNKES